MPPITIDESGKLLAAHATERDELYMINLHRAYKHSPPLRKIVLSDRAIDQQGDYAGWMLHNPATQKRENFVVALRNNATTHKTESVVRVQAAIERSKSAPVQPYYFLQSSRIIDKPKEFTALGDINFVSGTKHVPYVVSLSMETNNESDEKEKKSSMSYTLNYWNSENGQNIRSLPCKSPDSAPTYATGKSGQAVLCNDTECYFATRTSHLQMLYEEDDSNQCSDVRMSPSGAWVLHYNHMRRSEKYPYILMFPKIWYLGGERMKKLTEEDPTIDRRKWMMRLYTLERTCILNGQELRPPQDMQDTLGMQFAPLHKYDSGSTSKNKDSCIIS